MNTLNSEKELISENELALELRRRAGLKEEGSFDFIDYAVNSGKIKPVFPENLHGVNQPWHFKREDISQLNVSALLNEMKSDQRRRSGQDRRETYVISI